MKKLLTYFLIFLFAILINSCGEENLKKYVFKVEGKLSNSNNEWVIIQKLLPIGFEKIDSVKLDDMGEFKMEFKSTQPNELFVFSVKNYPWRITLLMQDGETAKINGDALYINQNYKIEGSKGSEELMTLSNTINNFTEAADSIYFAYRKAAADSNTVELRRNADSLLLDNYQQTYKYVKEFCSKNKDNLAGIIGLYSRYGEKMILDFEEDFNLFEIVATNSKIKFPENIHVISLNEYIDEYTTKINHQEEIESSLEAGKKLPLIELPNPDGIFINTDSMKGKYLILSFWISKHKTSWENNAGLKAIYKDYSSDKLSILSVGMEKDKLSWVNTIALDNLKWNQVLATENTIETFNLKEEPRLFLINPQGIIMAKDINIDSLNTLLKLNL